MLSMHNKSGPARPHAEDPGAGLSSTASVKPAATVSSASGIDSEQLRSAGNPALRDSALQQGTSAANAHESLSDAQNPTGSQHSDNPLHGTNDGDQLDSTGPTQAAGIVNRGAAPAEQASEGIHAQGLYPAAGAVPEGQLGDLPDKPGHLATAQQCQAANGGICWHLMQMAIKAREIARKADTVLEISARYQAAQVLRDLQKACTSLSSSFLHARTPDKLHMIIAAARGTIPCARPFCEATDAHEASTCMMMSCHHWHAGGSEPVYHPILVAHSTSSSRTLIQHVLQQSPVLLDADAAGPC